MGIICITLLLISIEYKTYICWPLTRIYWFLTIVILIYCCDVDTVSQNSNNALFIQLSFVGIIKKIFPCITNCNFRFRKVMKSKLTLKSWGHFLILVVMCFNQCLKKVRIPPTGTHPEV